MSVAENIFLGQSPTRFGVCIDRRAAERRAAALLAKFAVPLDPAAPLRSLGIGQKQLVEIVKALARESRILILDEPTAALAPRETAVLMGILRELRARGIACIYISHRLGEVFAIADRVTVLRDGAAVITLSANEADEATVVRHMVGREISDLYARRRQPPGEILLSVHALAVAEHGKPRLRDISFELRSGEVLGIGGLMGAGRTELLAHLFGAWGERTAGQVTMAGRPVPTGDPRAVLKAGIALVTEDRRRFGLFPEQSVGFNLSLASLGALAWWGVVRERAEYELNRRWFDHLGVRAAGLDAAVGRLSGGNQQKVVLGKMLMTQPRIVMLDEPTRGVDVAAKREIYALIDRLTAEGCAVLLASSELPELLGLSDRIVMLRGGTLSGSFSRTHATPELLMQAALGSWPARLDS